ncbi:hypothetical protein CONPUDRAFT_61661 [Coniophora puteana RWD-64-598 SS2]|uniref:G domain-containing protein n=1 Tax=Coniophora puteana (strain RWD-64-598) TaxID=741705 RepID=A0A5M3MG96_CONPW|nr:uncharacterized protein CONPUDRAFT_61661 [Coniophora puteana RWD-64-598 SS2]EIW77621.1 hypothetical protein CONPUDRAFT_61661 [Coniophora puteana RWD-64-598 SS2]
MSGPAEDVDIDDVRARCPVFRVLVIGRANAGKTTILQKVCNVDEDTQPVVFDEKGRKVSLAQRGRHDISHQVMYPGSRFVFHDSRGIESGADDEIKTIRNFLRERASKVSLAEQLHAIW